MNKQTFQEITDKYNTLKEKVESAENIEKVKQIIDNRTDRGFVYVQIVGSTGPSFPIDPQVLKAYLDGQKIIVDAEAEVLVGQIDIKHG